MPNLTATYAIAPRGLATSFTESETPVLYARRFRNRFINAAGGAEKRQGISAFGSTIATTPTLTGLHELVKADGTTIFFTSGEGAIWSEDGGTYTQVHSGLDSAARLKSMQMGSRLIFFNGVDRNFYTEDGTTFTELRAMSEKGQATSGTREDILMDSEIDNWVTDTDVVENDLVYNLTQGGYGIITAVATATIAHTDISPTATGIGIATATAASGDRYQIVDLVALNVIPTDDGDDNVATLAASSSATGIYVSAVADWTKTDVRVGDYIRNTTRTAVTQVTAISTAALRVHGITSQVVGDSIVLLKSAMPITTNGHVHFGRAYYIDARDERLIRISGPNDPTDMTTDTGTIDSASLKFGDLQPKGDKVLTLDSFQRFLVITGKSNVFMYQGTDPIADTSGAATDFDIIGLFPQGAVSSEAALSIGNDFAFVTPDGVQSISMVGDASSLGRANLSEALKSTLRTEIANTPEDDIQTWHYPSRSWYLLKIGSQIYVYNYTIYLGPEEVNRAAGTDLSVKGGSWSMFDGKFARQNTYFVRNDGTMYCAGAGGKVYKFDDGDYDDDGEIFNTEYQTPWLTLDEPKRTVNIKQGHYIKPVIESYTNISYTIVAEAGFDLTSTDTIIVTASGGSQPIGTAKVGTSKIGGSPVANFKHALRWRGEQARFTFSTFDNNGPDTISRYTIYATTYGVR